MQSNRLGVVLFQLGGPETLEAIEPFLFNLFCDPDIIDFPFARIGRKPLAKLISATRARKVQHHYAVIGGGSPIRKFTEQQAIALRRELGARGVDAVCVVAMRYWHPFTHEAIEMLRDEGCDQIVLLPLYPQYSSTTTGSSMNEWNRRFAPLAGPSLAGVPRALVTEFYRNEQYLEALAERINEALARFVIPAAKGQVPSANEAELPTLVFSAHSVPQSVIDAGDPYQRQIEETVELVCAVGGWKNPRRLCYQSKVGASKWLQPSLRTTLRELGANGTKQVCVVPISFVSDHVETLGEIDHEGREIATASGIERFEMTAGLNDSPAFVRALAGIVIEAAGMQLPALSQALAAGASPSVVG
jgi:protoporphyrin/coproporphyrin ferrochelatase